MKNTLLYTSLVCLCLTGSKALADPPEDEGMYTTPVNLSLFTPIELFPLKPRRVVGLSLNLLYGHEEELWGAQAGVVNSADLLRGVQLGVANISDGGTGVQIGLFQWVEGDLVGVQVGLTNYVRDFKGLQLSAGNIATRVKGIQLSPGSNINDSFSGIQVGLWNSNRKNFWGIQVGLLNENQMQTRGAGSIQVGNVEYSQLETTYHHGGRADGIQVGLILNQALVTNGAQIGIFNYSAKISGLQLGILNYTEELNGIQIGLLNFNTNGLFVSPGLNIGW